MTRPEYATLRDLVESVRNVDDKLSEHKISTEKRFGRIEKALAALAVIVFIPKLGGTDAATVASHVALVVTHNL